MCKNVSAVVVDPDCRGNICVILIKFSNDDFEVKRGDSIAQMVTECSSLVTTE